jgi:cytochrome P450
MSDKHTLPTGLQLSGLDPVFRENPHPCLDRLRAEDPVHHDTELGRLLLTRFDDGKDVLFNRSLSVDPRKAPPECFHRRAVMGDVPVEKFEPIMLQLDDPDHHRLRSLVNQAFNQRAADEFRPRIREIANEVLDAVSERDSFDVVSDYAIPFPIIAIAELLGVDSAEMDQFKLWSDALILMANPARTPEQSAQLATAQKELHAYFTRVAEARRHRRGTDLISALVSAEESGEQLTLREIATTCNLLLVAGNVTTTDLIGHGVLALLNHPDQLARLRANPKLAQSAVEEMLRYDPPITQRNRVTTQPMSIDGVEIAAGYTISTSIQAAGRDPSHYSDPHRFDIEREDIDHLAFGGGAHYCVGAPLARAEAQIAIPLLFERFPDIRLDPGHPIEHKSSPFFNGLKALQVRIRE